LTAAVWDGSLHPRGRDGKFITKFAILNIFDGVGFDKPSWRGKAVGSGRRPNGKEFVTVRVTNSGNTRHAVGTDIDVDVDRIETAPISKTRFIPGDTVRAKSDRTEHRVAEIRDDGTVVSTDGTELAPGEFEMSRRIARDEEVTDDLEFAPSTEPSAADKYAAGDVIQAKPEREAFLPGSRAKTLTVAEYNPETNRVIATDADGNEVEVNPDDYNMARRAHREGDKIEPSRMPTGDMTITGPKTNQPGPNQAKLDAASAEVLDRELRDSLKSLGIDPDAPDDDIDPEYAQLSDAVYAELSNRGVPWETVDDGTEEFIQNEWDAGNRDPVSIADRAQDLIAYGYEPEGGWPDSIAEDIDALNEAGIDDDEEDGAPVDVGVDAFFATDRVNWLDEDVYPLEELVEELDAAGYGDAHDRLDAAHGELSTAVVGGRKVEIVDAYENAESVLKEVSNDLPGDDPFGDRIAEMGERIGNRAEALRRETAGMSADGPSTAHIHDIIDAFESGEDNPADYADQLDKWEKFATDSGDGNLRNRIQGVRGHLANDTPADAGKPKVKPAWSGVPVEERPGWIRDDGQDNPAFTHPDSDRHIIETDDGKGWVTTDEDGTFGDTVYPSAEAAADAIEVEVGDGDPADVPDQIIPGNPGENNPGIIRNGTYYERDDAGAWWSDPGTSSAKRADDETDASLDAAWDAYDPDGTVQKMRMDGARVALEQDIANLGAPRTEADADQMADRIAQDSILDETRAVELRDLARAAVVPEGPTLFDDAPAPAPKAVDSSHAAAVRLSLKNSAANKGLDVDVDGRLDAALANEDRDAAYKDVAKLMTELKLGGKQRTRLRGLLDSHFGDDGNDSAAVMAKETAANLAPDNPLKPALEAKADAKLATPDYGYDKMSDRDLVAQWQIDYGDAFGPTDGKGNPALTALEEELEFRGIDTFVQDLDPNSFSADPPGVAPAVDSGVPDAAGLPAVWTAADRKAALDAGTTSRNTGDNPFAAHSSSVLESFARGDHGPGPWTTGPGNTGEVWGTLAHAQEEVQWRKDKAAHRRREAAAAKKAAAAQEATPDPFVTAPINKLDAASRLASKPDGFGDYAGSSDRDLVEAWIQSRIDGDTPAGLSDELDARGIDVNVPNLDPNSFDDGTGPKLDPELDDWLNSGPDLTELSDADLAARRAQLETYSKEYKAAHGVAPGSDHALGLIKAEAVHRGSANSAPAGYDFESRGLDSVGGYYNARRSGDPAKIKAADEALRRRAAEIGMTDDQFHEWLDSREGRWYGDAVVSGNKNPYDEAVAKLRPHVAMPGDLESWADNHGPLDELSDADLADRRAQLEVYSKEHKDRYATAPGTDSLLGLVRSEQVRRGMAKNGAEAAGPGLPGVDGFAGPAPEPGAKVYAHPMGARIYVNPDGSMEAYGKDGKKKKTSATPEKLAAGHGAWQPMDAVGAEPGPKTGYESLTNEELKAAYTPGIFIPSGPAGKAAHDSNKQIEAELAKRGITKEPPAAAAARAPIDLDELSWSDPTDVELAGRTVPELEAVLERIRANLDKMSKAAGPLGPGAQISHDRQLKLRAKVESLRAKAVAAAPPSANSVYNSLRDDGMTADPGVAGDAFRKLYTQDSNAPQFTAKINGMEYTLSRDEVRALIGAPPEGKA